MKFLSAKRRQAPSWFDGLTMRTTGKPHYRACFIDNSVQPQPNFPLNGAIHWRDPSVALMVSLSNHEGAWRQLIAGAGSAACGKLPL
jgi:hypothetical protein